MQTSSTGRASDLQSLGCRFDPDDCSQKQLDDLQGFNLGAYLLEYTRDSGSRDVGSNPASASAEWCNG